MNDGYLSAFFEVLPVLLLILTGFGLQKAKIFTQEMISGLKKLVTNLALPALLFMAFSGTQFEVIYLVIVMAVFLTCVFMVLLGGLIARLMHINNPYFALLMGGFEAGMLGYSLFLTAYGNQAVDRFAIVDLGQVLFVFFVLVTMLTRLKEENHSIKRTIELFIKSPVIIAIILGLTDSILKRYFSYGASEIYQSLTTYLTLLGDMTAPAILLVIGYELRINSRELALPIKTVGIRYSILLVIAILINRFLISNLVAYDPLFSHALYLMFVLPPPFVIPLFMSEDDLASKRYVLNTLSLSTAVSVALFLILIPILA